MKNKAFRRMMINEHLRKDEKARINRDLRRIQREQFLQHLLRCVFLVVVVAIIVGTILVIL